MKIDKVMILVTIVIMGVSVSLTQIQTLEQPGNLANDTIQIIIPNELSTMRDVAYDDFLTRNNHHIIRISEYQKYWGDEITNNSLDELLSNIKKERKIIDEFQPNLQSKEKLIKLQKDFRDTNDIVVSQLVNLLLDEYDLHIISQTSTNDNYNDNYNKITKSLVSQMNIASKITATSFPKIDSYPYFDPVASTFLLSQLTEEKIVASEKNDIIIRERHDVKEVGEDKNTIQVLFSVIKCQQELRINAEDYMSAQIQINKLINK